MTLILVADDRTKMLDTLERAISEGRNCTILRAENAQDAMKALLIDSRLPVRAIDSSPLRESVHDCECGDSGDLPRAMVCYAALAPNAERAVKVLEPLRQYFREPDLVISDPVMPLQPYTTIPALSANLETALGLAGVYLAWLARALWPEVPIILYSNLEFENILGHASHPRSWLNGRSSLSMVSGISGEGSNRLTSKPAETNGVLVSKLSEPSLKNGELKCVIDQLLHKFRLSEDSSLTSHVRLVM